LVRQLPTLTIDEKEIERTLQSLACGKFRVLSKSSKGKEIHTDDVFSVNADFTSSLFRIKINQIQLKETPQEQSDTHDAVKRDRQFEIQATIVRIMKSRKKIRHAELVAQVIEQTKNRGTLDMADIKKNIDKLMEKEYMEREEGTRDVYNYVA
jgi:Cullin protein neddylation domain/Cullin family